MSYCTIHAFPEEPQQHGMCIDNVHHKLHCFESLFVFQRKIWSRFVLNKALTLNVSKRNQIGTNRFPCIRSMFIFPSQKSDKMRLSRAEAHLYSCFSLFIEHLFLIFTWWLLGMHNSIKFVPQNRSFSIYSVDMKDQKGKVELMNNQSTS